MLPSPGIGTGREAGSIFCFQSDFISFQRETLAYQYFLGSLFFHLPGLASLWESKGTKKGARRRENTGKKKKSLNRQGETETERLPGVKSPKKDLLEVKDLYRLKRCQEMAEGSGEGVSPSSGYSQSCR